MNLVSNSIKFTLEGYIKVNIKYYPDTLNKIAFSVEDTGVGMSPSIL